MEKNNYPAAWSCLIQVGYWKVSSLWTYKVSAVLLALFSWNNWWIKKASLLLDLNLTHNSCFSESFLLTEVATASDIAATHSGCLSSYWNHSPFTRHFSLHLLLVYLNITEQIFLIARYRNTVFGFWYLQCNSVQVDSEGRRTGKAKLGDWPRIYWGSVP